MAALYPSIEPYEHGLLDVGDGNQVYWEECGNPGGRPAVVLHGGPGSGCTSGPRRFFDPDLYRIVLFDQRGCGRSLPNAADPAVDLSVNTTAQLLADLERLRTHLNVDRWLVLGHSWGSTLGLAYAERNRDRVTAVVLVAVTAGRRSEVDWLYRGGAARSLPEHWQRFRAGVPESERDGDLVAAYRRRLEDPDPDVRAEAARAWSDWDWAVSSIDPSIAPSGRWTDPEFLLARARICAHYFHHDMWLTDGELLTGAGTLADLPGVLINGRLDLGGVPSTASDLALVWPGSETVIVEGAGHSTADEAMVDAIVAATDRLARRS